MHLVRHQKCFLAFVLASTFFVSILSSLPLIHADYSWVDHTSFPPWIYGNAACAGDLTGPAGFGPDGSVNMRDIAFVARHFGSAYGGTNWDPRADVNNDGNVNMKDIVRVARLFGGSYQTSSGPQARSTSFEFDVLTTVNPVWYYMLVQIYVPQADAYNFIEDHVDGSVLNVKVDTQLESGGQNIALGSLSQGYHLLEFQFDTTGGSLVFHVATTNSAYAWLNRFRIIIPNYSTGMIDYTMATKTYFTGDDFFLAGFADKLIDNVVLDTKSWWPGWMWDTGSVSGGIGAVYGWSDGFSYPLGQPTINDLHTVSFHFGSYGNGILDFQYISWTNQQGMLGPPKFYSSAEISTSQHVTLNQEGLYGGSDWYGNSETSIRNITTISTYDVSYDDGRNTFSTTLDMTLGNWWDTWRLGASLAPDVAIPLNFTMVNFDSNLPSGWYYPGATYLNDVYLKDYTIDAYSFADLTLGGIEAPNAGHSGTTGVMAHDYSIAFNFAGTAVMGAAAFTTSVAIIGACTGVGLGLVGVSALLDYFAGQSVSQSNYKPVVHINDNHEQLQANGPMFFQDIGQKSSSSLSQSDLIFLAFNANQDYRCGLTEIVLKGTLGVKNIELYQQYEYTSDFPIGNIQITLCVPWFIWMS